MRWRGIILLAGLLAAGCASQPQPGAAGPYQTWDDVVNRWIGKNKVDLYYEIGPPNLHPKESGDGMVEMVWDFSIDRMPGQADDFNLLPMYGSTSNCKLVFFADANGVIRSGHRIGCD